MTTGELGTIAVFVVALVVLIGVRGEDRPQRRNFMNHRSE